MKSPIIILLIFTFSANYNYFFGKKVDGVIINGKDSIKVKFDIPVRLISKEPNYEKLQKKVRYTDYNGNQKTLKPKDASAIKFTINDREIVMISKYVDLKFIDFLPVNKNLFLKLEEGGKGLNLYQFYFTQNVPDGSGSIFTSSSYGEWSYILQKDGQKMMRVKQLSFRKNIIKYLDDCSSLMIKLENKEFTWEDLKEVVDYYNAECI